MAELEGPWLAPVTDQDHDVGAPPDVLALSATDPAGDSFWLMVPTTGAATKPETLTVKGWVSDPPAFETVTVPE